jgi:hypothetical protein
MVADASFRFEMQLLNGKVIDLTKVAEQFR